MCWPTEGWSNCSECHRSFSFWQGTAPCWKRENGSSCNQITTLEPEVRTWELCNDCKAARKAKEACSRSVLRLEPLYHDVPDIEILRDRRKAMRASYREDTKRQKTFRQQQHQKALDAARKAAAAAVAKAKTDAKQRADPKQDAKSKEKTDVIEPIPEEQVDEDELEAEDSIAAPPMITMRHQEMPLRCE